MHYAIQLTESAYRDGPRYLISEPGDGDAWGGGSREAALLYRHRSDALDVAVRLPVRCDVVVLSDR